MRNRPLIAYTDGGDFSINDQQWNTISQAVGDFFVNQPLFDRLRFAVHAGWCETVSGVAGTEDGGGVWWN